MNFSEYIQKNPIIDMDIAYDLLAYLSVTQHGIAYPETIAKALERIANHAANLTETNKNIPRKFIRFTEVSPDLAAEYPQSQYHEVFGSEIHTIGYDWHVSSVDFVKLLHYFNEGLISNGLSPLQLLPRQDAPIELSSISSSPDEILELVKGVAFVVRAIVDREDNVKTDTFEKVCNEAFHQIKDKFLHDLLREIKKSLKVIVKDKITKGRPKTITIEKMRASIDLAESFKDKKYKELSLTEVIEHLKRHHSGLATPDRQDVASVYLTTRKEAHEAS